MELETATFGYLRERLYLRTAGPVAGPLAIRDMRRVVDGERRPYATKSRRGISFPISLPLRRRVPACCLPHSRMLLRRGSRGVQLVALALALAT